jgi:aspartate/methionine/tyrosine aminotransferase
MAKYIKDLDEKQLEFQMFVLDELAEARKREGNDVIKLSIGISELEAPKEILDVISRTLYDNGKSHHVYPQGILELRQGIADYYNTQFCAAVKYENVIVNAGTSPIFRNLFQVVCEPGYEVLLPRPYYPLYVVSAFLAGAEVKHYDIDCNTKEIDIDSFARAFDPQKTLLVVLNTPGNPIGNLLTKEEINKIYNIINRQSFVLIDETYNNVCFYQEFVTPLSYLEKRDRDITIITSGFSKGFRLYTKRIGYAIIPDQLIQPMRIMQQHTLLTADPVSQYGMIEALKHLEYPRELTSIYRERSEYTMSKLKGTGCTPIKPEGGFNLLLDCNEWIEKHGFDSSKELARDILEKKGVATTPGTDFGLPNTIRLTFCSGRYNEAVDRLQEFFSNSK